MSVIEQANQIKDRLRSCETVDQIEQVADEVREKVYALKDAGPDGEAMFHQIRNLKIYMIRHIRQANDGPQVSERC